MPAPVATKKTAPIGKLTRAFSLTKITTREADVEGKRIGYLSGYLAVYGNRDWYDSSLRPGCFSKSLQDHAGKTFVLLADHDPSKPIGKFTAKEDEHGLFIEGEVFLGISYAMDKWLALTGGAIDGLSVGFNIVKHEYDEKQDLLMILEAKLWEGSVVTFPANDQARVEDLRNIGSGAGVLMLDLTECMKQLNAELPDQVLRLAAGDKVAATRADKLLDLAAEKIEALRTSFKLDAAASETVEPPHGHSAEDMQELSALAQQITSLAIKA